MLRAKSLLLSSFLLLLSACGYRWTPDFPAHTRPTVMIPYAAGDETGALTAHVITELQASGLVDVRQKDAQFRLELAVVGDRTDTIGFRRDRQEIRGKVRKNLLACEGRRTLELEVRLVRLADETIAWGPERLIAEADYDYVDGDSIQDLAFVNSAGVPVTVLPFSLGQLEPIESAQEAAQHPVYTRLAKKIIDAIASEW